MSLNLKDIKEACLEHIVVVLILLVVGIPSMWGLASWHYGERIETLREQVTLLRQQLDLVRVQLDFLESKVGIPTAVAKRGEDVTPSVNGNAPDPAGTSYPSPEDPTRLTKSEVERLARFYGLFDEWPTNPQLQFQTGDLSYWYEQSLSEPQLRREFESRRIALQQAEASKERIPTQGDLSHAAEQIARTLEMPLKNP